MAVDGDNDNHALVPWRMTAAAAASMLSSRDTEGTKIHNASIDGKGSLSMMLPLVVRL